MILLPLEYLIRLDAIPSSGTLSIDRRWEGNLIPPSFCLARWIFLSSVLSQPDECTVMAWRNV